MNTIKTKIQSALQILNAQTRRIGNELEPGSDNLKALVANQDEKTQAQISSVSDSLSELSQGLHEARKQLEDAYARSLEMAPDNEESLVSKTPDEKDGQGISAKEAAKIRHDEPITLSSIFRSLLMANEPAQREKNGALD